MGKHIAKFATETDIQNAVNNFILMKPYIAMNEANTTIDFNKKEKVADLILEGIQTTQVGTKIVNEGAPISTYTCDTSSTEYTYDTSTGLLLPYSGVQSIYCNLTSTSFDLTFSRINKIVIGEGITSLGAFRSATGNLNEVVLPSTLNSIYYLSIQGCSKITCKATTAPPIGYRILNIPSTGTLYIPSGSDYSSWFGENKLPSTWTISYI